MLDAGNNLALPPTQGSIKAAMLSATRYLKRELDADVQPVSSSPFSTIHIIPRTEIPTSVILNKTDFTNLHKAWRHLSPRRANEIN